MDIGAVVLSKILESQDLEAWSRVKPAYFGYEYTSILTAISKYYSTYETIPSFEDLDVISRDLPLKRAIATLKTSLVDPIEDIDINIAIDALIAQYTQNEALKQIDKFLDKITLMDTTEIKEALAEMTMAIDEKVADTSEVFDCRAIDIFDSADKATTDRFPSGLNNTFDAELGGIYRHELILLGGKRGSGKSVVCSNLSVAQYEMGNSVVYFTIEMSAEEVVKRNFSILANVSHQHLRKNTLTEQDVQKLAKVKSEMFVGAEECYQEFLEHKNRFAFEQELRRFEPKPDNQLIIVDNRNLSLADIDVHLHKLKSKFGDKLTLVVIDYVNQIVVPGVPDMYDWKTQIHISKTLKNYARKYNVGIVSPIQLDDNNGVRFAKGLLDSPDIALILNPHDRSDEAISFESSKLRSAPPITFTSGINWDSLRISPVDVVINTKKKSSAKDEQNPQEKASDLTPWSPA